MGGFEEEGAFQSLPRLYTDSTPLHSGHKSMITNEATHFPTDAAAVLQGQPYMCSRTHCSAAISRMWHEQLCTHVTESLCLLLAREHAAW